MVLYFGYLNAVPDFRPDQEHDSFTYISLARSLLADGSYPTKHWMPGFPVMLSIALSWVGMDLFRLKLLMVGISLFTLMLSARLFERIVGGSAARPLALLLAATPVYFDYSHRLMSELPVLAMSLLALVALVELCDPSSGRRARIGWATLLAVGSSSALLIRGNALALIPALGAQLLALRGPFFRSRRWACGLVLSVLLAIHCTWSIRCARAHYAGIDNITYFQEVQVEDSDIGHLWEAGGYTEGVRRIGPRGLARRVFQNIAWHQSYRVASLTVPTADRLGSLKLPYIGFGLALLFSVPVAVGAVVLAKRSWPLVCYLAGTLALVIVYPTGGSPRMIIPSIPLLLAAAFLGIEWVFGNRAALGWALTSICVGLVQCGIQAEERTQHPYSYDEFSDFLTVVRQDVPRSSAPTEVVVAPHPLVVRAFTGQKTASLSEALSRLESREIPSFLQIAPSTSNEEPARDRPGGIVGEVVVQRGKFALVRWKPSLGGRSSEGITWLPRSASKGTAP